MKIVKLQIKVVLFWRNVEAMLMVTNVKLRGNIIGGRAIPAQEANPRAEVQRM